MKIWSAFFIMALFSLSINNRLSAISFPLPLLTHPHCLRVADGRVFVLQDGTVFIHELSDGRLLNRFGRIGDGPGESRIFARRGGMLALSGNRVMIDGLHKIIFFSFSGVLEEEIKKDQAHFFNLPAGDGFVSLSRRSTDRGDILFQLHRSDRRCVDSPALASQPPSASRNSLDLFPDALNFAVLPRSVVFEQNGRIHIVPLDGKEPATVPLPEPDMPVTEALKAAQLAGLAEDDEIRQSGGLEALQKRTNLLCPGRISSVRELSVSRDAIFIWTTVKAAGQSLFWVLDCSGRFLGSTLLPAVESVALDDALTGRLDRLFCFDGDDYYYLALDDEECWNLHALNWRRNLQASPR